MKHLRKIHILQPRIKKWIIGNHWKKATIYQTKEHKLLQNCRHQNKFILTNFWTGKKTIAKFYVCTLCVSIYWEWCRDLYISILEFSAVEWIKRCFVLRTVYTSSHVAENFWTKDDQTPLYYSKGILKVVVCRPSWRWLNWNFGRYLQNAAMMEPDFRKNTNFSV